MEVFISYSSKDVEVVKRACAALKDCGISYWVAYENECFGEQYAITIINQISECKAFLIFVSRNSNLSSHVINEINSAVMRDKLILPVLLDDVKLSPAMEYYLASNHYLNYSSSEQNFVQLTERACKLLGKQCKQVVATSVNTEMRCDELDALLNNAQKGDLDAICELGRAYYNGLYGVNKDLHKAFELFLDAANKGHAPAQCNVAWCYEVGDGVENDLKLAYDWYLKSANGDCSMAQYSLGWMHANGIFVPKNQSKAINWFIKAAENNHAMAQYKLGMAYLEGLGVDENAMIANHWLMLSADQGIVFAQYQLAENYFVGRGCKQDVIKAKQMWLLSAERGFEKSADALEKNYDIFYMDENKNFLA